MKLVLACVVAVAATGCSMFRDGSVSGRVESKGEAGDWVLAKGACYSGQREQYFGAIALGPEGSGIAIKLVKDGVKGWTAVINQAETCKAGAEKAACRAIVLDATKCRRLEVDLATTNTTVNDIRVIAGKLAIDCAAGDSSIQGELTFDYCH